MYLKHNCLIELSRALKLPFPFPYQIIERLTPFSLAPAVWRLVQKDVGRGFDAKPSFYSSKQIV